MSLEQSKKMFALAILKGNVEHGDGGIYFGSLGGYFYYRDEAVERGWITMEDIAPTPGVRPVGRREVVTEKGREEYKRLALAELPTTPHSRAYMWNWGDRLE